MSNIVNFIKRRFINDCDWTSGNCYYFAIILKSRFPDGQIYYDVVNGHFIFKYNNNFYDWNGVVTDVGIPILWETFEIDYDPIQYKKIIENCIK